MDKRSIFERGFAILLSVILMAACFPLSSFAEDTTDPDFSGTNLMNLENVQPSGYTTTTNPYGYDIGKPFLMVEQNELMYLNAWDNRVRQASYFSMGSESALETFAKNKSGSSGTFSNPNYKLMQAVSFDPTGSGRRDHVAFVGVSGQNKKGYMWVIDTTKGTDSDCSQQVEIGDFSYMFDGNDFEVPTYSNRSFLNIVAGDFDGDGKESIVVYTPKQMSHGFFFNSSIKWGKEDVAMHGVTTSLQYSDGKGNSTSKGTAVGASCTVTSLDKQSLVAEGIPAPVVDAYRFHWTLGQWQRHLSGAANNKTPLSATVLPIFPLRREPSTIWTRQ